MVFQGVVVPALSLAFCAALAAPAPRSHAPGPPAQQQPTPQQGGARQAPAFDEWGDDFGGAALDEAKWERFSFEGGGGKVEVKEGELRIRSSNRSRAGVRSKAAFTADRFSVEASVAKVGPQYPEPGDRSSQLGFAALTVLFDGGGRNRIEWIFTSEKTLEAWLVVDGRGERLDNRKLGLKFDRPTLAVIRKGDDFLFVVNKPDGTAQDAQVALTKTVKNMPRSFHVMLYGFGSSENNWDSVRVVTMK